MMKTACVRLFLHVAYGIATCFGVGKAKYAPGTFGSLIGLLFSYIFLLLFKEIYLFTVFIIVFFFIGLIATFFYIRRNASTFKETRKKTDGKLPHDDPSEVIIDEVVGQMIASLFSTTFMGFFLTFLLFRIFDITKPWPINYVDRHVKGALGVMLDDVLAAVFSLIVFFVIFHFKTLIV